MSRDEAINIIDGQLTTLKKIKAMGEDDELFLLSLEAKEIALKDMKKMAEIERLLEAYEVPGGLLLAIREVVEK